MRVFLWYYFLMEYVFVAIDGSNFYHKLKDLGCKHTITFDYTRFIKWLIKGKKLKECCFYIGQIREEPNNSKSQQLKRDQDKLFSILEKAGIKVKRGYILRSGDKYHEKGVDVQISVDICMKAVRNEYDQLFLLSSDTDLIPAIKEVQTLGKKIEYVGFDNSPSFALIRFSDSRTLLKKEDLATFFS